MKHLLFIALGGAGGALARHWMSTLVHASAKSHFPWGTLSVNLLGSFCLGIMYVVIVERGLIHPDWRSITIVGFLGKIIFTGGKAMGHGDDYRYAHDELDAFAAGENYFPELLKDRRYYFPSERGLEQKIAEKLAYLRERDKQSTIRRYE